MPVIRYVEINRLTGSAMLPLMKAEAGMWLADLGWDYSIVQQILLYLIREKMLPGYAAFSGGKNPDGYVYFLASRTRGSIGACYVTPATPPDKAREITDGLLELAISRLQGSGEISRIETQMFAFHGQDYAPVFNKYGFRRYPRLYLVRGVDSDAAEEEPTAPVKIIPWDSALMAPAAGMTAASYLNHQDYEILEDYHTPANCENYLQGLVTKPGCGVFLQDASFMCVDGGGAPCGYVICSRISDGRAMIPQIAAHPAWQGRGIGTALMSRCLRQLKAMNFNSLSLVVTAENSRALEWYRRMGFQPVREFNAFIWNRT